MGDLEPTSGAGARIRIEADQHTATAILRGELDLSNAEELLDLLAPVLDSSAVTTIVFDVGELTFMDSSGLAVLLRVAGSGRTVRLRHPAPIVRDLLSVSGLADVLAEES